METKQAVWARALNPLVARLYHYRRYRTLRDFPRSLILEATNRCNLRCRMCPRNTMKRPVRDMTPGLFRELVDQAAADDHEKNLRFMALHWFGESLLHPQILDMIDYAGTKLPHLRAEGLERCAVSGLCLSTNATVLTEDLARALLDSQLTWLAVSVDGTDASVYEDMRTGGDFDRVIANVERLLEINSERFRELPTVAVQIIVTQTTAPGLRQAVQRWQGRMGAAANARVELKPYTDWAGQIVAPNLQRPDTRTGFFYLNCGYLHDTLVIGAGGEVGLCCYDVDAAHDIGNAAKTSLRDIWHGAGMNELRRLHALGRLDNLPLCRNCAMGKKHPLDYLPWHKHRTLDAAGDCPEAGNTSREGDML